VKRTVMGREGETSGRDFRGAQEASQVRRGGARARERAHTRASSTTCSRNAPRRGPGNSVPVLPVHGCHGNLFNASGTHRRAHARRAGSTPARGVSRCRERFAENERLHERQHGYCIISPHFSARVSPAWKHARTSHLTEKRNGGTEGKYCDWRTEFVSESADVTFPALSKFQRVFRGRDRIK